MHPENRSWEAAGLLDLVAALEVGAGRIELPARRLKVCRSTTDLRPLGLLPYVAGTVYDPSTSCHVVGPGATQHER